MTKQKTAKLDLGGKETTIIGEVAAGFKGGSIGMTEDKRGTARGLVTYPHVRGFLPPSVGKPTGEDNLLMETVLGKRGHPQRIAGVVPPSPYVSPETFSGLLQQGSC